MIFGWLPPRGVPRVVHLVFGQNASPWSRRAPSSSTAGHRVSDVGDWHSWPLAGTVGSIKSSGYIEQDEWLNSGYWRVSQKQSPGVSSKHKFLYISFYELQIQVQLRYANVSVSQCPWKKTGHARHDTSQTAAVLLHSGLRMFLTAGTQELIGAAPVYLSLLYM